MSRSGLMLLVGMVAASGVLPAGANAPGLDLESRVAAQAAIERVYWSHRIWPAGNDGPKPAFDAVIPESALRAAVENSLLQSRALQEIWGRPIGVPELKAEIERMTATSRAPLVLQEIFAALGNDPVLVSETLARPILTDRLIRGAYASDPRFHQELKAGIERSLARRPNVAELRKDAEYGEATWERGGRAEKGRRRGGARVIPMDEESWSRSVSRLREAFEAGSSRGRVHPGVDDLPVGILGNLQEDDERFFVQAVLEKNEAQVKVATVAWRKTSFDEWWAKTSVDIASGTRDLAAVTGGGASFESLPAPAANNCTADTWTAVQTTGAPSGRLFFTSIWTGSEMIVWGGYSGASNLDTNTGGLYNPATNSWTATSLTSAPVLRDSHTAVWTGTRMVIWGGGDEVFTPKNTGGRYDPATNTWQATRTTGAPTARLYHTAVWSGSRMIVWGGWNGNHTDFNTGGLYDPGADTWTATNTSGSPIAREQHTAVWTGTRMIVWGGADDLDTVMNTGGRYDPAANTWLATSLTAPPPGRFTHSAVWTGSRMIVWGGSDGATVLNGGSVYDPVADTWTPTSTTGAPIARNQHVAVWADAVSEMIVWGGTDNAAVPLTSGGRYNPATGAWAATSTVAAPAPRKWAAATWTGSEMIVWGGWSEAGQMDLNTGGRYCDGACSAPPPGGASTISVGVGGAGDVSWSAIPGADSYDLVRGSLSLLGSSGGNFTTSLQTCLANDQAGLSFPDGAVPAAGNGFYYLVRGASCGGAGTYDHVGGNQVGSRDAEISASPASCP